MKKSDLNLMKTMQYKTYICCDAVELLPNSKEAAQHVVQWNKISALQVDLLMKLNKLQWTIWSIYKSTINIT